MNKLRKSEKTNRKFVVTVQYGFPLEDKASSLIQGYGRSKFLEDILRATRVRLPNEF